MMLRTYTQSTVAETAHHIIEAITIFLIVLTLTVYLISGITYFTHWINSEENQVDQAQSRGHPQQRIRRPRSRLRRQRRQRESLGQRQTSVRRRARQRTVREIPEEVFVPIPGTNRELRLTVRQKNRRVSRRHRSPEH